MRILFILLALALSASAEVIVYKGTARTALDATSQFSRLPRMYLVIDRSNDTNYMLFYYKLSGVKHSQGFAPLDHTRYNGEAIGINRFGTFTTVLDNDLGGGEFGVLMLYLRGRETSLILANNGAPTTGNFPKVLTGILREAQLIGALGTNFEFNMTLTFDALHTQAANNGFKNGATTIADIGSELSALGY